MKGKKALFSGLVLFIIGGLTLFTERMTHSGISAWLGRLYCGNTYLQPTTGQPGVAMCGFNMDMVVGLACFFLLLIGFGLILFSAVKMIAKRKGK